MQENEGTAGAESLNCPQNSSTLKAPAGPVLQIGGVHDCHL